jgi:hypothetical protein
MSLSKSIITKLNPKKLKENILRLPAIVKKDKWQLSYDKLVDALYFTPSIVAKDTVLFSVSKELNIYVNSNSDIKGIFVENFSANFVKHNEDFKGLLNVLNKKGDDQIFVAEDEAKAELYGKALEASLLEVINNKNELLYPDKFA